MDNKNFTLMRTPFAVTLYNFWNIIYFWLDYAIIKTF